MGKGWENRFCVFAWVVRDETGKWGVDDGHLFHCFQPFSGRKNEDERLQELIC